MSGFVMMPDWLRRKQPSGNAALVYWNLGSFGTWNPGTARYEECRPSLDRLAKETGLSKSTVKRAIAELLELGALERRLGENADGSSAPSVYRLVFGEVVEPSRGRDSPVNPSPRSTGESPGSPPVTPNQEPLTQTVSDLKWSGPPSACAHEDDQPSAITPQPTAAPKTTATRAEFVDWRVEDRTLFASLVGDTLVSDGTAWQAGSWPAVAWYEALRTHEAKPIDWPGRYVQRLDDEGGLDSWLAGRGLEMTWGQDAAA